MWEGGGGQFMKCSGCHGEGRRVSAVGEGRAWSVEVIRPRRTCTIRTGASIIAHAHRISSSTRLHFQ